MRPSTGLLRDALAHSAGYVVSTLATFVLVPFLLRGFAAGDYGVWLVSLSASAALGTVTVALWWVVSREVAGAEARGDVPRAFMSDAFTSTVLASALGAVLLSVAGARGWIAPATSIGQSAVLRLTGVTFFWEQIAACATAVLAGQRRFVALNAIQIVASILRASSIVLIAVGGGSLLDVALCHIAFTTVSALALVVTMLMGTPWLRALRPVVPLSALRTQWRFASLVQLTTLVSSGTVQLVPLIVARIFGADAVVPLYIGLRLPQAASSLAHRVSETAYPRLVQAAARGGMTAVRDAVARATRWAGALALTGAIVLYVAAPLILHLWLGSYSSDTLAICRLAAAAFFFEAVSLPMDCALVAAGHAGTVLVIAVCCAVVQVAVVVWLLQTMGVRAAGVALLASCVVYAVAYFIAGEGIGLVKWRERSA